MKKIYRRDNVYAENHFLIVEHIRQTEVEDIYQITHKRTKKVEYEKFPRSMYQTADNVLSYYE